MSEYLESSQKSVIYCLTGVLMHVGPDANHGHYIAHIQVSVSFFFSVIMEVLAGT